MVLLLPWEFPVCALSAGDLYFERFLNEQRGDCPDIDIDICGARRDELLDYVYARWGAEHVAMIGSFITMHARLAVREVAKVFGVPPDEVNHFTKRLPHRPVREILAAIQHLPECRTLPVNDEPWKNDPAGGVAAGRLRRGIWDFIHAAR